jgi:lycopene beta-cyclase
MIDADFIIAGGGASGLSLALRMVDSIQLKNKEIIIIEKEVKKLNDRTWCFWEQGTGYFEDIIHHKWQYLRMDGEGQYLTENIAPYEYKMLRAQDFYQYAKNKLNAFSNIKWVQANIEKIETTNAYTLVKTNLGAFKADWCFSSISNQEIDKENNLYLDQHFKGWFIRTANPVFNPEEAHFMDFRTPQCDETRFLYVLPYNANEALVEIAIFSRNHLSVNQYEEILETYLQHHWHLKLGDDYEVIEEEDGNIPMTDATFKKAEGRVIYIGMAGGDTRSSTGFTFLNIQRRVKKIVEALENGSNPGKKNWVDRFRWYDQVLLRVLEEKKLAGENLFMQLFSKNPMQRLLAFLQGESNIIMEIKVMQTAPWKLFILSACKTLLGMKINRRN